LIWLVLTAIEETINP